ncbi:MAG: DUF6883 domain-containing protein [Bacteroidota bacterium]
MKNASDMYRRRGALPEDSVILVLFKNGSKSAGEPSLVGCLDFGGMSVEDIEGKFRRWADPDASGDAAGVQGGHGNGGKCYMTQMFEAHSYAHTLKNGRASRYGFQSGSLTPGYFGQRDDTVEDPDAELNQALVDFGLTISDLPEAARTAWESSRGFTLLKGVSAKDTESPHGMKYVVDGDLPTPSGHSVRVRTVWIVDPTDPRPRLITAYSA